MDKKCVDNLRILALNEIENAKSGHPGVALSAAPIFYSLYANVMNYDIFDDKFILRDRFVNSAGHSSSINYATLHAFGFDVKTEDLKKFRQLGSITPGHPEFNKTSGIDCSTGPLGQGVANAVGMAIAGKFFAEKFNKSDIKLFDNKIYCFVGDGCLMEGISYEALNIAGNLKLDNLILIYDCNKRTIDGALDIASSEDVKKRFEAIGFETFEVKDGNNVDEITSNILKAKECQNPSIVIVNTKLGFASEFEDDSKVHGNPLNKEQIEYVKKKLEIEAKDFEILPEVKQYLDEIKLNIQKRVKNQRELLKDYQKKYPKDYEKLLEFLNFDENKDAVQKVKNFEVNKFQSMREINHDIFNSFKLENMLGGSADVEASTKMVNSSFEIFSSKNYCGQKICYGIREHAMAGISNGICLFGGTLCYACCFLPFMDYLKPSLRMTMLMNLPVLYCFTHDSVLIGEDGPTHQAIEQLISLRAIPNITVFRAYNDAEIKACYVYYLESKKPTVLIISRSKYEFKDTKIDDALCGAYVIKENVNKDYITLISTGYDVDIALKTAEILEKENIGVRVVSMPSCEIFDKQPNEYKEKVLGKDSRIFTLESGSELGLIKYVRNGKALGLDCFGESGKPDELMEHFGLKPEQIAEKIKKCL
ncbi:MAG: transketolase [Clostridiales bacterium]|nr:transketolase [Candidatus Apopatousia equi]